MTIQSVSQTASTPNTGVVGIKQIQSQVASLERQIAAERQSSDDDKTKAKKIQALELQIQQLQAKLLQMQEKAAAQASIKTSANSAKQNVR